MAPPRFYARGAFLALYVGVDEEIVRVLQTTFGVPFAGEGAPTPDTGWLAQTADGKVLARFAVR